MFEKLKKSNPEIEFYNVNDKEFATFGRIINNLDTAEIIKVAKGIPNPDSGSSYVPNCEEFESLEISEEIQNNFFGTLPAQLGYCWGHNILMNATEWHFCSEVNIAVTPLVLILGHVWDIQNGKIDSSKFKAFYIPAGTAIEVFSTTLHFCPCEVDENGFGCVVGLVKDTNTNLAVQTDDKLLFRKNKWIIAHIHNDALIARGVVAGITGENFEIKY